MELLEGPQALGHLLRRAGFGPTPSTWKTLSALPYEDVVKRVADDLTSGLPDDPGGFSTYKPGAIQQLWLERMVSGPIGAAEKLTLFWHGHFATSNTKIKDAALMWAQYKLFRSKGAGRFEDLVRGVSRGVAMVRWLDGNSNRKGNANENYARELQELFTLGIGNYSETDVREVARAFTGWGSRHHEFKFRPEFHDDGDKTIHGETGPWDGDDAIRILLTQKACPRFLATKLLRFYVRPDPQPGEVDWLAKTLRDNDLKIAPTLEALWRSPIFLNPKCYRTLVRSPVSFVVDALRACDLRAVPAWVHGGLDRMGQILFRPPSVKGWTSGKGWLHSGAVVERLRMAQRFAALAPFDAADQVTKVAFQDDVPQDLAEKLEERRGPERVALALGGPEFQLA